MKKVILLLIMSIAISGCGAYHYITDVATLPADLVSSNLNEPSSALDIFMKVAEAPESEWKTISLTKWKYDRGWAKLWGYKQDCREYKKRHIPSGMISEGSECRPMATAYNMQFNLRGGNYIVLPQSNDSVRNANKYRDQYDAIVDIAGPSGLGADSIFEGAKRIKGDERVLGMHEQRITGDIGLIYRSTYQWFFIVLPENRDLLTSSFQQIDKQSTRTLARVKLIAEATPELEKEIKRLGLNNVTESTTQISDNDLESILDGSYLNKN